MAELTEYIHKILQQRNKTIAVAESCTGGILSKILTDKPGSSKYFILGITPYSNRHKSSILKIPCSIISRKGAVSRIVAILLAKNIRKIAKADLGVGITGIAGPSGATLNKPVGTVFIAVSNGKKTLCKKFRFCGSRSSIRKQAALQSLKSLKSIL